VTADDGAVVYVNGTEVVRQRMSEGAASPVAPGVTHTETSPRDTLTQTNARSTPCTCHTITY